jgi:error-prone DNA polymerase
MGWNNPPIPWAEFERLMSWRRPDPALGGRPAGMDGGESPAWSRKREPYRSEVTRDLDVDPWYELHCHSNFSFLDGASHPEELIEQAARLGTHGVALTDHDGMYGVVRFAEAAHSTGVRTLFGAELSLDLPAPQTGIPDPEGRHLLVLARDKDGYATLSRAISQAQFAGAEKGRPVYDLEALGGAAGGRWLVLTGCRKGLVPAALAAAGPDAAARELDRLVGLFGREHVAVELIDHGNPTDSRRNDALADLAGRLDLPTVATNNVHYATPRGTRLAAALAAVRARRGLDELDGWLPACGGAYLRTAAEMTRRFARYPGIVARTVEIGQSCTFPLDLFSRKLPTFTTPEGMDEMAYLRQVVMKGAEQRYGEGYPERAMALGKIEHELGVIHDQGFPGYFLIVWQIVEYCRENGILCQGRGSAVNSAVCYALGITAVDAVKYELLFERFLSTARGDEAPDIDLDIESGRREEVIQYVYEEYGRQCAAQVANVITYRPKSAVRDMARALGYAPGQQDAWSKQVDNYEVLSGQNGHDIPADVVELARQVVGFPRHLGIHSGGMVLCDRPVVEVCPVEHARMKDRTVLQWDKDDCAHARLVKFDLLGLGMLSALRFAFEMIEEHHGEKYDLQSFPRQDDDDVYDMLCAADTVGVFQVESRAQMATLPRLRPRRFYDLVVEVAIIRPGPIQGGSVHPYINRRTKGEKWEHLHPLLKKSLDKTLGVPLFQEQLMQIAMDVAGFSAKKSDELRRALSAKRSREKLAKLKPELMSGMAGNGVPEDVAEVIYEKLIAFADFGFPESHAFSFAALVYISAWLKLHYPAAFCAALLKAQPMGFYSAQSLVADARRHGVLVRGPDVNASADTPTLEPPAYLPADQPQPGPCARPAGGPQPVVRLGLASVRHVGDDLAARIAAGRPYADLADLVTRHELSTTVVEALATAGALDCFGLTRREALWAAGAVSRLRGDQLPGAEPTGTPTLPGMSGVEEAVADLWATGITPARYPTEFVRARLAELGVVPAARLRDQPRDTWVLVAGVVTHRQRPSTARGVTFINLEDETGFSNVICTRSVWQRFRRVARESGALLVHGKVENTDGVVNIVADRLVELPLRTRHTSRDFR